jgi:hypothetical protein
MGQNVANVELATDYSTNSACLRLHIDLPIPMGEKGRIQDLMDNGQFNEAFSKVKHISNKKHHQLLESFQSAFNASRSVGA